MKILIGCEYSGIVRDAFIAVGHNAISCDLLETEAPGPHIKGDILNILDNDWDMMIAHPPCQYLSFAGNKYLNLAKYGEAAEQRYYDRVEAMIFFNKLWNAPIKKICLENPMGLPSQIIKPFQTIHPYFFGDKEMKRTCLFLKNLPPLVHTKQDTLFETKTHIAPPEPIYIDKSGKNRHSTEARAGKAKDAAKQRAKFFKGVAAAMAQQWG